jgi:hypothetical protein
MTAWQLSAIKTLSKSTTARTSRLLLDNAQIATLQSSLLWIANIAIALQTGNRQLTTQRFMRKCLGGTVAIWQQARANGGAKRTEQWHSLLSDSRITSPVKSKLPIVTAVLGYYF